ncbi:hypothetical protein ACTMU2_18080 [Cupriavidus basilensis]
MTQQSSATRDEVLRAFAMEFGESSATLKRYLTSFPQYAVDLVDLSRELSRGEVVDHELTAEDAVGVRLALERFRSKRPRNADLPELQPKAFAVVVSTLNLPIQVVIAFRERRVDLASVPVGFRNALARALGTTRGILENFLALPPQVSPARASKSGVKPVAAEKVPFERVLTDAGLSPERISELMSTEE